MALPPTEHDESFVREVDENLRRDQTEQWIKKNGALIAGAALLFLAAIAGWLYWQDKQRKAASGDSENLVAAIDDSLGKRPKAAEEKLAPLTDSSAEGIATQAKLMQAGMLVEKGDRTGALKIYDAVAADSGLADPYRDLATLRSVALQFDQLPPQDVITRLAALAKPESAWFGSAGELTAMALIKQGKKEEAGRMFAAIASNKDVPVTIRSRAVQIAGTLGVDATAAIADISKG
ncbi:MAG: tetratricopeptide repeat protein [Sphingomicrobium sp.]